MNGLSWWVKIKEWIGDYIYDYSTNKKSILVSRGHGKSSLIEEYIGDKTDLEVITCDDDKKIAVVGVYGATDASTGEIALDFKNKTKKIFRFYASKYQHSGEDDFHKSGTEGESVILSTTTGGDKVFIIVNYRILKA